MMDLGGIPGRNLTYGMFDALGRAIVTGAYDGIAFPTEGDLSRQYGVSRSVTREAVKMLTSKGLLSARPRQGTIIQPQSSWNMLDADVLRWLLDRKFSLRLLRHFTELRYALEPEAAALAARFPSADALERVEAGYRRMAAAEAGEDEPLLADIAFHIAVLEASGNPFFMQMRDLVTTALHSSIRFTNRFRGRTASLPEHKAVMDAIFAGKDKEAAAAVRLLIANVMQLIEAAEEKET